jgi:hypothetical protein
MNCKKDFHGVSVMLAGAGRRVALAQRFQARGCTVVGYELDTNVPLHDVAAVYAGKKWSDPDIVQDLNAACRLHGVNIIIPLDCRGVAALSMMHLDFRALVPNPAAAQACLDKQKFALLCEAAAPDLYPSPAYGFPAVEKPVRGFGSNGINFIDRYPGSNDQSRWGDFVYQKRMFGKEYSVDAYFNYQGQLVGASPRERIRVASGEVIETETVNRPDLVEATRRLGEAMNMTGPTCFQFIDDAENGRPYVMECNARFGGGGTLGCEAGVDMVDFVLRERIRGEYLTAGSATAKVGVRMSRSYRDHFFGG